MATTTVSWLTDVERALAQARVEGKLAFIEFSQAPRCAGSVALETQVYADERVSRFLFDHFVPARLIRSEHPQEVVQFNIVWTPTQLVLEPDGTERFRQVGFLPSDEFVPYLELGLATAAFGRRDFAAAQAAFEAIVERSPTAHAAAEAAYWGGVSEYYKRDRDRSALKQAAERLRDRYVTTEWAKKASVWLT